MNGEIEAGQPGVLFTSIPYDKGWTLKVDGIKQEPGKIFDTFLSVDIPAGRHIIEMSYEPEGLRAGAAVTAFSILCLLAEKGKPLWKKRNFKKENCGKTRRT